MGDYYVSPGGLDATALFYVTDDAIQAWRHDETGWSPLETKVEGHVRTGVEWDPTAYDKVTDDDAADIVGEWGYGWHEPD